MTDTSLQNALGLGNNQPSAAAPVNPDIKIFGAENAPKLANQKGIMGQIAQYLRQIYAGHFDGNMTVRESKLLDPISVGGPDKTQLQQLNTLIGMAGYGYVKPNDKTPLKTLKSHYDSFLSAYKTGLVANPKMTIYDFINGMYQKGQLLDPSTLGTSGTGGGGSKHYIIPPTSPTGPAGVGSPTPTTVATTYDGLIGQLENWGFNEKQLGTLGPRAWKAINSGVDTSKGIDVWLRQQPEYAQQFPGNIARIKQGLPPLAESTYTSYVQAMQEAGRAAGLPTGFLTGKEIGTLIANEVKPAEFTQRLTNAYEAVQKADPAVLQALQQHYNLKPGQLAAWALDPHKATDLVSQEVQQAKYMAETKMAGFNQDMSAKQAQSIAQYQATAGVSEGAIRQQIDTAARYQALEGQAPGQQRAGLTQAQLIGAQVGNDPAARQAFDIARAQQMTPMQGGGGDIMNAKGVTGAGFATGEGTAPVR